MEIIKELLALKETYTEELKKAQAKCEVVDDLLVKFSVPAVEEEPAEEELAEEETVEEIVE